MDIGLIIQKPFPNETKLVNHLQQLNHLVIPYHLEDRQFPQIQFHKLDLLILANTSHFQTIGLIKTVKSQHKIPIIIIGRATSTSVKNDYLKIGASYYLETSQDLHTLSDVLKWLYAKNKPAPVPQEITFKDLALDPNSRMVKRKDRSYRLANKEYRLLKYFLNYPNQILSKQLLLEAIWDINADLNSTTLETHICKLRKKIDTGFQEKRLHTIPYSGYILK